MKTSVYLVLKYWRRHKKNLAAVMFSGVLTVAVVFAALMQLRGVFNRELHKLYDEYGMFDLQLPEASEETIARFVDENEAPEFGYVYALGKAGIGALEYTLGYADDPRGLMHIPLESGVMPSNNGEAAIDRSVLNNLNWAGTLGDTITLGTEAYTVVGIIDESYGRNRAGSELWNANIESEFPIPLIYVAPSKAAEPLYKITLASGIISGAEECEKATEALFDEYGGQEYGWSVQYRELLVHIVRNMDTFRLDTRWILILSGVAAMIAVLSVFSVLRSVFIERRGFVEILRRIGTSKKNLRLMYAVELLCLSAAQAIIGAALGALGSAAVEGFRVGVLGECGFSAFTTDILVTSNTASPLLVSAVFGILIISAAYLLTIITAAAGCRKIKKSKKPRSLRGSFSAVFRQRGVSAIQTISLALIGFGVMTGYMYYTRDGKEMLNYLKFDFPVSYRIGRNGDFDMKEDGIAEYYTCGSPAEYTIQTYEGENEQFVLADDNYKLGLRDGDVEQFANVTACGELSQTFVISDSENADYPDSIIFREPEIEALVQFSSDKYKDFFAEGKLGTKHLYRLSTLLANPETIEKLSEYVVSGEINAARLDEGLEIIIVTGGGCPFDVGETLRIGSAMKNDSSGIGDVSETEVVVGAVVNLPKNADKMLRYAAKGDGRCNLLTTAKGAAANGFHNAVYTELFAGEDIDGGLIPSSAGARLISYRELKRREFLENASEYGGLIMLFALMSLLGFSAYFSGIGIKVRQRSYEISTLRAVGTPLKTIRAKLLADGLAIPLLSTAAAGGGVFALQRFSESKYNKLGQIYSSDINEGEFINKYFLNKQIWSVPTAKPLLAILLVMCAVTAILTMLSLKKFKRDIANDLNSGRTKQ